MRCTECRLVTTVLILKGVKPTSAFLSPFLVSPYRRHIIQSFGSDVRWD